MAGDVFMTCFVNCYVDELVFLKIRGEKVKQLVKEIMWNNLSSRDPLKKQCKLEIQKIIHFQI